MLIYCARALPPRLEARGAPAECGPLCGRTEHGVWAIIPSAHLCATEGGSRVSYRSHAFSLCSSISSSLFCSHEIDRSAERDGLEERPSQEEGGGRGGEQPGRPGAGRGSEPA